MNVLAEGLDLIFKNPSSIFISMKAVELIDNGIDIDCNQTKYAGKVVCAEMRRTKTLKIMNDEKTRLRYRWFDKVCITDFFRLSPLKTSSQHFFS